MSAEISSSEEPIYMSRSEDSKRDFFPIARILPGANPADIDTLRAIIRSFVELGEKRLEGANGVGITKVHDVFGIALRLSGSDVDYVSMIETSPLKDAPAIEIDAVGEIWAC